MLQVHPITDAAEWNSLLGEIPRAHVLQTWEWGEFKAHYGWQAARLRLEKAGKPVAAAQVLRRNLPRLPFGLLYVPRGPAVDYADPTRVDEALSALEAYARRQNAILIKIDPDLETTAASAPLLKNRGWRLSREQIQFRNTVTLDLGRPEEEILAGMKPKWRYNIRLAERRGVEIGPGGTGTLAEFYKMYAETSARDGFLIRPYRYYHDAWGAFLEAGLAHMLLARVGQELVAGLILFRFRSRAWYFYGASRGAHREKMPNHLLQWEAIRLARSRGCAEYDFWGAPDKFDESDPMHGVYRFKEGFGGRPVQTVGANDFVVNPPLFQLYARLYPWYIERMRRRHVPETA